MSMKMPSASGRAASPLRLGAEVVEVGGGVVEIGPAGIAGVAADMGEGVVGRDGAPFGVHRGGEFIPGGGEVDGALMPTAWSASSCARVRLKLRPGCITPTVVG